MDRDEVGDQLSRLHREVECLSEEFKALQLTISKSEVPNTVGPLWVGTEKEDYLNNLSRRISELSDQQDDLKGPLHESYVEYANLVLANLERKADTNLIRMLANQCASTASLLIEAFLGGVAMLLPRITSIHIFSCTSQLMLTWTIRTSMVRLRCLKWTELCCLTALAGDTEVYALVLEKFDSSIRRRCWLISGRS